VKLFLAKTAGSCQQASRTRYAAGDAVGFSGSNGRPFLLQVMECRFERVFASRPVTFFGRQVDQCELRLAVAAGDDVQSARLGRALPSPGAFADNLLRRRL